MVGQRWLQLWIVMNPWWWFDEPWNSIGCSYIMLYSHLFELLPALRYMYIEIGSGSFASMWFWFCLCMFVTMPPAGSNLEDDRREAPGFVPRGSLFVSGGSCWHDWSMLSADAWDVLRESEGSNLDLHETWCLTENKAAVNKQTNHFSLPTLLILAA